MRIVSLTCSNTEIVCALGCGEQLVGVDDHSDYPAETLQGLPRVGPDLDIDIGAVAALKPDLVLGSLTVPGHEKVVEALQSAGLPTLVLAPERLRDIENDIGTIGAELEVEARAVALIDSMRREIESLSHAVDRDREPVPILVEWWPKPVIVPGRDSWVNDLLESVGALNPFGDHPAKSLPIEAAQACAAKIAGISISWCGVEERRYRPEKVWTREGWGRVPAVEGRMILPISEAYLGRPGPRVVEGARRLGELVAQIRSQEKSR